MIPINSYTPQPTNAMIPIFKNPMLPPNQNYNLEPIELSPYSEEYKSVAENFYRSVKNKQIVKIAKITNFFLEQRFNQIKDFFFANGLLCKQEAWHGTKNFETYKKIINEGFLIGGVNVNSKNGNAFGNGVNTSLDASVCIQYCEKSEHILLCEVVTGREVNNFNNIDQNSNSFRGNNVLVLFNPSQVIPRFLVKFK